MNFGAAIRCYELGGEKMQKDLMSCYAGLGDTLYKTSDFNGAYAKHAAALRFSAQIAQICYARSIMRLGKKTEALQNYEKALELANKILEKSGDEHAKRLQSEIETEMRKL